MPALPPLTWDVFCQVVDNHGDLGVCWRLARDLAARGHRVRLWVDDARALAWMAPGALAGAVDGVRVLPWTQPIDAALLASLPPSQVWIEAFGCTIAPEFMADRVQRASAQSESGATPPVWVNLEYLSAERYVERMHALPSPVLHGPAAGRTKWFFYPGFTPRTGGLLREADLAARQAAFDRAGWRRARGLPTDDGELIASLFCYEPPALRPWLAERVDASVRTHLLVTHGRAQAHVCRIGLEEKWPKLNAHGHKMLSISYQTALPQPEYDELLWGCDLNFVRGEDSLVRALWAGQPFIWNIYPQHDDAHHAKLEAFLDWLDAPPTLRRFHRTWNGLDARTLPPMDWPEWRACARAARARLLAQSDLGSQLIRFVAEKG